MTSFRATPISNDITKIVRNHYNPKPAKPYKFTKVWNRTSTNLLEERPKSLWERHYHRRQGNLHKGFHSIPWEPYRDIGGDVYLDPYDLVLKTLSNSLDDEVWSAPHKQFYDDKIKDWKKKKVLPAIKMEDEIRSPNMAEEPKPEDLASIPALNGYRKVRDQLAENAKIIRCVKGGQSYDEYVRQQQELQQKGEEDTHQDNDMVLMCIKDLQMGLVHLAESDSEEENDIDDDTISVEQEKMASSVMNRMSKIRKSLALPSATDFENIAKGSMDPIDEGDDMADLEGSETSPTPLIKISSGVTEKKERIRRDHLNYLESLYIVIVSIHNVKGRDLKSKVPLSLGAVKALEKFYNPAHLPPVHTGDRESKLNYLAIHRFQSKLQKCSTTTVDSSTDGGSHRAKLPDIGTPAARKVMIQEPAPSSAASNVQSKGTLFAGRRKSIRVPMEAILLTIQEKRRVIIETWEDLVNLQVSQHRAAAGTPAMGVHANIILKAMHWKKMHGNQNVLPSGGSTASSGSPRGQTPHYDEPPPYVAEKKETTPTRKLPIWQQVASEKYPKTAPSKKKCANTKHVGNLAYNNRKKLNKVRSTVQQELDASLQKIEREKMVSFKMKYQVFEDLSPLFPEHVINMRRGKTNMARNVDVHHVPPSKWYDELREKTYSITGQNDPEINNILNKLSQFSTMDTKTIHHAKAKLCLLVMSLPAYSILKICMQKAIKYVLETILLGDLSMLVDWLSHRKFPMVLDLSIESTPERGEKDKGNQENTDNQENAENTDNADNQETTDNQENTDTEKGQ
ncbi:uncharacterized protein LOC132550001 [Ylistrum balloti]|uniref:uncharacterized protein LOC132550001 n=1 Tax=Ylistrum balloti TaxID=509963 RepID=UPI002905AD72|nr:uncharacterized protein LOC132550001 [Ylistrum balloti]